MDLPDYNSAQGGLYASEVKPPFYFNGTIMRVFPLRAKLNRLQSFIDGYINIAPEEVGYFRPFLPYVYLVFIYYGKMSLDAASLGWVAQNEVLFSVPLLWYKKARGQYVFHDFAFVSPFIYVDNDHSMTTGREVYGWPKDYVESDNLATSWMKNPEADRVLARFSANVFSELYAGERMRPHTLLEVGYSMGSSLTRMPFDPRAAWLPWSFMTKAVSGSVDLMYDYIDALRGLGVLRWQPGAGPDAYATILARLAQTLNPYRPELVANTINLKQFRDAERPSFAAYQAITNAPMKLQRFQGGGLLGEGHMLQGDPSGGFYIDVHHHSTHPIVDALGLEIARERITRGRTVHTLKPMFPMWLEADLCYNIGHTIAWRARGYTWRDGAGRDLGAPSRDEDQRYNTARGAADVEISGPFEFPQVTLRVLPLLAEKSKLQAFLDDRFGGLLKNLSQETLDQITDEFTNRDLRIDCAQALSEIKKGDPSEADVQRAIDFVKQHIKDKRAYTARELRELIGLYSRQAGSDAPPGDVRPSGIQDSPADRGESAGLKIEPWGSYVYLLVATSDEMSSSTNNVGSWAERELLFYVPAKITIDGRLWKVVIVPAYAYTDGTTDALTGAEVSGFPFVKATLESPSNVWMSDRGPADFTQRTLLLARTTVLPAVGLGQEAKERTIIEVFEGDPIPAEDEERWRIVSEGWIRTRKDEVEKNYKSRSSPEGYERFTKARAFALQMLTCERPIRSMTLKQFRDAAEPAKACYQAVVETAFQITRVHHIEEIESGLYVRLHHYPTQPIMETLGLVPMISEWKNGVLTHIFQPVRPFWARISMRENVGRNIFVRAGSKTWRAPEPTTGEVDKPTAVGTKMVSKIQLEAEPRRLSEMIFRREDDQPVAYPHYEDTYELECDVQEIVQTFGPQHVLESMLSEEWERRGECRWVRELAQMKKGLPPASPGVDPEWIQEEIQALFKNLRFPPRSDPRLQQSVSAVYHSLAEVLYYRTLQAYFTSIQASGFASRTGARAKTAGAKAKLIKTYKARLSDLEAHRGLFDLSGHGERLVINKEAWLLKFEREIKLGEKSSTEDIGIKALKADEARHNTLMILAKLRQRSYDFIPHEFVANVNERERVFPEGVFV